MAALPVKEAQCRQMFSSCGGGRGKKSEPSRHLAQGRGAEPTSRIPTKLSHCL